MKKVICLLVVCFGVLSSVVTSFAYDIPGNVCGKGYNQQKVNGAVNCVAEGRTSDVSTIAINTTNTNYYIYSKIERYNRVNNSVTTLKTEVGYGKLGMAIVSTASRAYNNTSYMYSHLAFVSTSAAPGDANIVAYQGICAYQYNH